MAKRTAVLLTVFNRKEVTLKGLRSLYKAIAQLPKGENEFDIYMTDDGCTDGTGDAVRQEFPEVHIIQGDGNLYWSGGMRAAWQAAIDSKIKYDYYLWFNDDADLYEDALVTLFSSQESMEKEIITGAFCDEKGIISYGGRDRNKTLLEPRRERQEVFLMNGNLVLIPNRVYDELGLIDNRFIHGGGDFDYGLRANEKGFKVLLSKGVVGVCNRHDEAIPKCYLSKYSLKERLNILKSPMYNPSIQFYLNKKVYGFIRACITYVLSYIGVMSPTIYEFIKIKFRKSSL